MARRQRSGRATTMSSSTIFRDRYRVLRRLGAGGGGSVYEVEDIRAAGSPRLALKALFAEGAETAELLGLLRQEFRVLSSLRHPAVARVYDFGRFPQGSGLEGSEGAQGYYYTRDLVDGVDLASYCAARPLVETLEVLHATTEALDILHRAGMVHRDFKPGNVIVDHEGGAHLIDFGLAHGEGQRTPTSGTAAYLAPEMLRGHRVDRRADLYALGITLYELVRGEPPLPGASLSRLVVWHLDGPELDFEGVAGVPERLSEICRRLTSRDPEARFPSAGELALALAEVIVELGGKRPDEVSPFVAPAVGDRLGPPLSELENAVRSALEGKGPKVATACGDPGSGRSTLLRQLTWRLQLADIEVVSGEFQAGDLRPYGVIGDLLAQLASFADRPNPLRDIGESAAVDRFALYQQITEYLVDMASHVPVTLVLDGLEAADDESRAALRFVAHVLDANDRVCLVVSHDGHSAIEELFDDPREVTLAPLDGDDVSRMLKDASGRSDERLAGRIVEHTGGNAAFVVDVLRRLHEANWPASPDLEALAPPQALESRVAERYAELAQDERIVLETLAVVGRPARGLELLELVQTVDGEDRVGLPLERLEALGWISRNTEGAWSYLQGPARHAIYRVIDTERRRALHLAAARRLQDAGDERADIERTRHALAAGELEMARRSLQQATAALEALGSHRQAIGLCEHALELASDGRERRALLLRLGRLYRIVGDTDRAITLLEQASERVDGDGGSDDDGGERRAVRLELARTHTAAVRGEHALEVLAALDADAQSDAERLEVAVLRAAAVASLHDLERLLRVADEGLAIEARLAAIGQPDASARAGLGGRKAWSLAHLARYEEADGVVATALDAARSAQDKRVEAELLNTWAVLAQRAGKYAIIADRQRHALAAMQELGDVGRVAAFRVNIGAVHLQRGELGSALDHLQQSLRLFEAMGSPTTALVRCNLGYVQLQIGLYERARVTLERAREQNVAAKRHSGEALARLLLAILAGRRGDMERARSEIAWARDAYVKQGQNRDAADAQVDLAELELRAGNVDAAARALATARSELDLAEVDDLLVRVSALDARLAAAGDSGEAHAEALSAIERAIEKARALDTLELSWQCNAAAATLSAKASNGMLAAQRARAAMEVLRRMAQGFSPDQQTAFWQDPWRREVRERAGSQVLDQAAATISSTGSLPGTVVAAALDETMPSSSYKDIVRAAQERHYRLLEIYRRINAELDPERLLGLVMDTAVELTGAERGFLLLGDRPESLEVKIARNLDPERSSAAYSRSIAEQVHAIGEPVVTISAHSDPRFSEYASVHQLQLESVCCIPIHAHGRIAGVLYMESRFKSGRFTPDDQRLLMAFGDQVAIALTNAQLMAENQRKAEALEAAKREIEALADERGRLLQERTEQLHEVQRDLAETRARLEPRAGQFGMVGRSAAMAKVFNLVERVSGADVPVLIEGESGTGKEMVARAIHEQSPRHKKRLVSVNCAAIPENLLESELFGHVRGAFTGADRERKGLFQAADGGTLFLDEISDMPSRMQVDLLRALQEHTIRPVGGQKDVKVDVRVIAAANRPLSALVERGEFREDLFYRLHVVRLALPALRERPDDIPLLVDHFLGVIAERMHMPKRGITKAALRRLMSYGWPGNVRQLEHALMNAVVLADGEVLHEDDFSLESPRGTGEHAAVPSGSGAFDGDGGSRAAAASESDREAEERERIMEALERCNWNKSKAARVLGIPRRTFYRRLRAYDIQ
ncbi:MAG: sigma 54-interacting transcriptional regulator [Myxococcales bacterium]|nr:sigma 54-interacting transcriptional regulator [Myxococcales bacterium]